MSLRNIARQLNFVALLLVIFVTTALVAQEPPSKVDIFAGYSWLHPGDNNHGLTGQKDIPSGFTVSGTYFGSRYAGFTVDTGYHTGSTANIATVEVGPTVRFPTENITPFAHALVGWNRMDVFGLGAADNGVGLMVGGGMDLRALKRVSIRLFQADYQYAHHHYPPPGANIRPNLEGARLSSGLVFHFGEIGGTAKAPASASCSVQPQEVFAGEPVSVTATGSNFDPKKTVNYAWSATGVKVNGTGQTANVDTAGLQPGSYQVKANLTDGTKKGVAECTASFTVKSPRAPSISCSANPSTVQTGGTSTISSNASSADNRRLTYKYSASSGTISGNDASATLNTAGAQPGTITVNCTATDDRNLSASSTTSVNVEAPAPPPPPPAAPEASKLNQIAFKKNSPRVDNTAKAILDDVALRLQRDADAKAVLVGQADPSEKGSKRIAAQRAQNTKTYLVKEKGIDPSRIEVRTGSDNATQTDIWLVPAGATFNGQGTEVVSEQAARAPARKGAAKAAPATKAPAKKAPAKKTP